MDLSLQTAVLKTLVFFDIMQFAPTIEECQQYLYEYDKPVSMQEIEQVFATIPRVRKIDGSGESGLSPRFASLSIKLSPEATHFYVLEGHEQLVSLRKTKEFWSRQYWQKVDRWKWLFRFVPYLKKVYVCNNLAFENVTRESDIDLFIITAPNRLFITRFILTGLFNLFGIRRHGKKIAGRFCLSFWQTEDAPELMPIQPEDPYLVFWKKSLKLIYEKNHPEKTTRFLVAFSTFNMSLTSKIELFLQNYQLNRIERKKLRLSNPQGILATTKTLKLHNYDSRRDIAEKWRALLFRILPMSS